MKKQLLGPLMVDIAGTVLSESERQRLLHPLVGGIILFSRNYESRLQLQALCTEIHALRYPPLLIGIDHEGGRVQRCVEGFTRLPAMRSLGEQWDQDKVQAELMAEAIGYVLASELRVCGVDFSFTPVLDLDWGKSVVIGRRAFHSQPAAVIALAGALIRGLHRAGMIACGKHFPGHGWVEADSHTDCPLDERHLSELANDLLPYRALPLDAIMPSHVIYKNVDLKTACFSKYWIEFLRKNIGFSGVIFSDDLSMQGASVAGDLLSRVRAAYDAGCDMLLVCNSPEQVEQLLLEWSLELDLTRARKIEKLLPKPREFSATDPLYQSGVRFALALSN